MVEARYTMLFKDWLNTNTVPEPLPPVTYKSLLKTYMDNKYENVDADTLIDMLESMYEYYEISELGEIMLSFMKDVFNEYGQYYSELFTNYKKEYDYALNNKRVISKSDSLSMVGNTKIDVDSKDKQTEYQLPNKVIDETYRSTTSTIVDNDNESNNNKDYTNDTTRESITTTEFNNEFIDLKNKYINQIRNIYHEFSMKFKDCFYQIY